MAALPNEGAEINYWGVPIPVQPANPSSYNDGFDSLRIERQVQYQQRGIVDNLAVAQAARYANRVPEIAQPPQWVVELQQTLNYVQHMLNNMQQKFRNLEQRQNKTCALVVKRLNTSTARTGPFNEVPFHDGTWPWGTQVAAADGRPVNLPNLDSEQAVRNLRFNCEKSALVGCFVPPF